MYGPLRPFPFRNPEPERPPAHLLAEFQSAVLPFADAFCASIERRFERALRDGCAQLQGKFRSLAEHFSRIEPPELRHLRFDEKPARESDEFDTGFAGNDRLFSFSVVPSAAIFPGPPTRLAR